MKNNTALVVVEVLIGLAIIIGVWGGVYYASMYYSEDYRMGTIVAIGNERMAEEDYGGAIEKYDEALEFEPENDDIKSAISHAYVQMGSELGN